jgi:hypothetical protein
LEQLFYSTIGAVVATNEIIVTLESTVFEKRKGLYLWKKLGSTRGDNATQVEEINKRGRNSIMKKNKNKK